MHRHGGINRYFTELMRAYCSESDLGVEPVLRARFVASQYVVDAGLGRRWAVDPRLLRYAERVRPSGPRSRRGLDLVHHTYYRPKYLGGSWTIPRITTIHDMIPEMLPQFFPNGNPHQAKREYVALSGGLVFVSETSRRDLFRLYGAQDIPTTVAHLAPGEAFHPRSTHSSFESKGYMLFVGSRGAYKDFDTLLLALGRVRASSLSLIAVGGGDLDDRELARIEQLGLVGRVRQTTTDDDELARLYSYADALVMPSRYEGFGLPVVEAMASGCPIVLSDIEIFREVADEVACYFPVGDADALAALLDRIHEDAELRRASREKGLVRIKDFTWSRAARRTSSLYRQVLSAGPR